MSTTTDSSTWTSTPAASGAATAAAGSPALAGQTLLNGPEAAPPNAAEAAGAGAAASSTAGGSFRDYIGTDGRFVPGWAERLPETHKAYAATAAKFASPLDLVASYGELEKKLGQKLTPPNEQSRPEDWERWRSMTGAPRTPQEYALQRPERLPEGVDWNEADAGRLAEIAHRHALSQSAVRDILGLALERSEQNAARAHGQMAQYVDGQKEILAQKWGAQFTPNLMEAQRAAKMLGADLGDPEIGNNAKVIELAYNAARLMREDRVLGGAQGSAAWKSQSEQIEEIRRSDAYNNKLGPEAQRAAAERIMMLSGLKG